MNDSNEATKDVMETLSPAPVMWQLGNKFFEQKPLRIDRLGAVMQEIVDIVFEGGRAEILDQLLDAVGTKKVDAEAVQAQFTPALVRMLAGLPSRLPNVVGLIMVDVEEEYLIEHLKVRMALDIVKTFVEQNEIGGMIEGFFGLIGSVTQSVADATTEQTEQTEQPEQTEQTEQPEQPEEEASEKP